MTADLVQAGYLAAVVLFVVGLRAMSSPRSARRGILWAGAGMLAAVAVTFLDAGLADAGLALVALALGAAVAWVAARRVAMTDMPQMVAVYNGMGGGAAALIAAVELLQADGLGAAHAAFAVTGGLVGSVAFSGSVLAFAKLQGLVRRSLLFPGQNAANLALLGAAVALAGLLAVRAAGEGAVAGGLLALFFLVALAYGAAMTLPVGGADMPVVISLYNALTGLAVGFEGYVLGNVALVVAGVVVGAAGTLLTQLMARAMNRSLANVLFSGFGAAAGVEAVAEGTVKELSPDDAAVAMAYAQRVVIVPGYGMAVAQAQHKVWELARLLQERGVQVTFAIHPVAGRMPGHMNVLLAEAGVPYDLIRDLDEVNPEFPVTDVALVVGANDVVNPAARDDRGSPIYGMPVLDVDRARMVVVVKRGRGTGFAGVPNRLFTADGTRMVYGDAQDVLAKMVLAVKRL